MPAKLHTVSDNYPASPDTLGWLLSEDVHTCTVPVFHGHTVPARTPFDDNGCRSPRRNKDSHMHTVYLEMNITKLRQCSIQETFRDVKMSRVVGKPTIWFPNRSDTKTGLYKHRRRLETGNFGFRK